MISNFPVETGHEFKQGAAIAGRSTTDHTAFMKHRFFSIRCAVHAVLIGTLHGQVPAISTPVLTTPGTATWQAEAISTGTRTVFTITENTVLDWASLHVGSGSELVFNFVSGERVLNFLGGSGSHVIDGVVSSNGHVAFFSPQADLTINGSITARAVTLSTLRVDAEDFGDGNGYRMTGSGALNFLTVDGAVKSAGGETVIAGERVIVGENARLESTHAVRIGGGGDLTVATSGGKRISGTDGDGYVLHLGETRAGRIEMAAGGEIRNQGRIDAGNGRIFLSVGGSGLITNESNGLIVGNAVFSGAYEAEGKVFTPDEGDSVPTVSDSTLTLPALSRPNGSKVSSTRTVSYSAPMSASGDAGRDAARTKRTAQASASKPLLQRSSFFGMRGGTATPSKR